MLRLNAIHNEFCLSKLHYVADKLLTLQWKVSTFRLILHCADILYQKSVKIDSLTSVSSIKEFETKCINASMFLSKRTKSKSF